MDVNSSWLWMVGMALALGVRHGFDLDHLATIDAIARTVRHNRLLSKMVGCLFSLGHGLVVTLISLIIGSGLIRSHVPEWLDGFGNWISIVFLVIFGLLNLWNVFQDTSQATLPVGIRSFLAKKLVGHNCSPGLIMMIGALFALSFDTVSQISLFSISAAFVSGWAFSGLLGISFMLGMMLSDGLNGLFVSTLIQRADRASLIFSRSLGVTISIFSLTLGCIGLWNFLVPR